MTTLRAGARGRADTSSALSLHGLTIILFFAASSITTPLFPLYQADWGVSAFQISVIFAAYVGTLLVALLFMGGLSNHFGRRPVLLGALVIEGLALVMFLLADSGSWLIAARLVQRFATGIATTAVAAALLDVDQKTGSLINSLAPMAGMALGALGAGLLVQFAPLPLRLVYALALVLAAIQLLRTWRSPETFRNRASMGWSLRPRIEIPKALRRIFAQIIPLNVAVWGVGALFLSLLPGLLHEISPNPSMGWLSGAEVGLMTLLGGVAVLLFRNRTATSARIWAGAMLIAGIALILLGTMLQNPWLLLTGAVPTGIGFGAGFLGVLRALVARAQPEERAGLMSAFYIASYLPNALLAMIAGYAAQRYGVTDTVLTFGAFIILMAGTSFAMIRNPALS